MAANRWSPSDVLGIAGLNNCIGTKKYCKEDEDWNCTRRINKKNCVSAEDTLRQMSTIDVTAGDFSEPLTKLSGLLLCARKDRKDHQEQKKEIIAMWEDKIQQFAETSIQQGGDTNMENARSIEDSLVRGMNNLWGEVD